MKEYKVILDTGIAGYELTESVEAESAEQAKTEAVFKAEEDLRFMIRRLRVVKVEETE